MIVMKKWIQTKMMMRKKSNNILRKRKREYHEHFNSTYTAHNYGLVFQLVTIAIFEFLNIFTTTDSLNFTIFNDIKKNRHMRSRHASRGGG